MDIFEIFRKKEIKIEPGKNLSVEFLRSNNVRELFPQKGDDLLYIKKHLCKDDLLYLETFDGHVTVKTEEPDQLDDFDLQSKLFEISEFNVISNIGLNYVHVNDILFIFNDEVQESSVPNVVKLYPMNRTEVESLYTKVVTEEVNKEDIGSSKSTESKDDTSENIKDNVDNDNILVNIKEKKPEKAKELELILRKLKEIFDENYTVISVEVKGVNIERKTISLNDFYSDNEINPGRLKGSWILFTKEDIEKKIEPRLFDRARDEINKKYILNIGGYGNVIKKEKISEYYQELETIISNYISYLSGEEVAKIGNIKIEKKFDAKSLIEKSATELREYLFSIQVKSEKRDEFEHNIENFVYPYIDYGLDLTSDIKLKKKELTFTDRQWQNTDFLEKLIQSVENDKREFFITEFENVLSRYDELTAKCEIRSFQKLHR